MTTASPAPLRIFAFLLIPFASWQVWLFPGIPNYHAQHWLIYPSLLFMLWAWRQGLWTVGEAWRLVRPFLPWLALLVALQLVAEWRSAQRFLPEGASLWSALLLGFARLAAQIPFIFFYALLCRVLLSDSAARRNLLRGALWTFALLLCWCTVQGIYIYTTSHTYLPAVPPADDPWYRVLLRELMQIISPWLEARWSESVYDYYKNGAYALTLARFNGFFEEASALASMTAVFFTPLSFGLLALGKAYPRLFRAGAACLAGSLAILILCRSATGQILAIGTVALLVPFALRGLRKMLKIFLLMSLGIACLIAVLYAVPNYLALHTKLLKSQDTPRVVCLLDTLDMLREHPLIGVGRSWYFAHLHQGQRYMAHLDDPELRDWKESGRGGELSALPALAAQYGLPAICLAFAFVTHVWWRLYRMPPSPLTTFMAASCTAWLVLGSLAGLLALDIRNPLFSLPFFFSWAAAQGCTRQGAAKDNGCST